nr:hypothetical protein UPHDAKEK_UPHDAKEK_CDS_0008 [Microvirus sp.]
MSLNIAIKLNKMKNYLKTITTTSRSLFNIHTICFFSSLLKYSL